MAKGIQKDGVRKGAKSLIKKKQHAVDNKNIREASIYSRELAEYYKTSGCDYYDDAINEYYDCIKLCKKCGNFEDISYCHRGLCDIFIDSGEYEKALEEIDCVIENGEKIRNPGIIQLAKHQKAYIYYQSYQNGVWSDIDILKKALNNAKNADMYLESVSKEIDNSKKMIESGGDSRRRKAGLTQLIGDIYADLHMMDIAEKHYNVAVNYFTCKSEFQQLYHCLYSIYFIKKGEKKFEIAKKMLAVSEKIKDKCKTIEKIKAKFYYGVECGRMKNFEEARNVLYKIYKDNHISENFRCVAMKIIIFLYKYVERLKDIDKKSNYEKMKIYEILGDEADLLRNEDVSCYQDVGRIRYDEISLECYKKMLSYAKTFKEKVAAMESIALSYIDMELYSEALEYFNKLLKLQKNECDNSTEILETEAQILNCQSKIGQLDSNIIKKEYDRLISLCKKDSFRKIILEGYVDFLNRSEDKSPIDILSLDKYRKEYENLCDTVVTLEEDFTESESSDIDIFEGLTEEEIFNRVEEKLKDEAEKERLIRDIDKKINHNGECLLHELAKKENGWREMIKLIECNYNVNVVDYGGWTPLSEAVSHDCYDNAAYLLKHGAIVDCTSKESVIEGEAKVASEGVTPLMEAAQRGNIKMMKLLLKYGADVIKENSEGNNALDYLRLFFSENKHDLTNLERNECNDMIKELEDMIKRYGGKIKEKANPVVEEKPLLPNVAETRKNISEDQANYLVYKSTMNNVARRVEGIDTVITKKNFDNFSDDESEDEIVIDLSKPEEFEETADIYGDEDISVQIRKRKSPINNVRDTQRQMKLRKTADSDIISKDDNDDEDDEILVSKRSINSSLPKDVIYESPTKSLSSMGKDSASSVLSSASSYGIPKVTIDFEIIESSHNNILKTESGVRKEKGISVYEIEKIVKSLIQEKYTSLKLYLFDQELTSPTITLDELIGKSNACKIVVKLEGWQPLSLLEIYKKLSDINMKPSIEHRVKKIENSDANFFKSLSKWLQFNDDLIVNFEGCDLSDDLLNQSVDMSFLFTHARELNLKCTHIRPGQLQKILQSLVKKKSSLVYLDLSFNKFYIYNLIRLLTYCPNLVTLKLNHCEMDKKTPEMLEKLLKSLSFIQSLKYLEIEGTLKDYEEKLQAYCLEKEILLFV
ncbi:Tonsoku-like protein [Strongyloides ratti]|uniref:Tonsoku-like protein n=1 Tax=Strongyloides ratti TaxID=34506 RepID=A0A090L9Z2_STRRB|nr:Tonsoku-like protein [Strongyloides ratti]CEF64958.1 Tonsoku-like protein [Strongyloides ratti]